jgi:hypothetical protein
MLNNKKWLYSFSVEESVKKEDGKIEKKNVEFSLLKPNRRLKEDGELFFAAETSRFARAGVLPKAAWNTILSNGGGSISDKEREVYGELLIKFRDASLELQSILFKTENDRSEVEKKRSDELVQELDQIKKDIQSFESSQIAIFENTAEAKARNRTILWWVVNLAYKKSGDNYLPIFEGNNFEEKLDFYDSLEENSENDKFLIPILRRLTYLITLWFLGKAEDSAEFKYFDDLYSKDSKTEEAPKTEESENNSEPVTVTDRPEEKSQ